MELIKINNSEERQTTSARSLWEFLEKPYDKFTKWFDKYKEYGFVENEDYRDVCTKIHTSNGAEHNATDYEITIDMAKELAMLQKSEKGKEARQYFIQAEKNWNSPDMIWARAVAMSNKKLAEFQNINIQLQLENKQKDQIILELTPKASYYDHILQTKTIVPVTLIAKDYGMSGKAFNKLLCDCSIQYSFHKTYLLTQKYADKGYTSSKTHTYNNKEGIEQVSMQTQWTQKGRLFLYDFLKNKKSLLPMIER